MLKAFFSGYMTRDPEIVHRETRNGKERLIVRFAIAHNKHWYDQDGKLKKKTTYLELSAFGSDAKYVSDYLREGSYIAGLAGIENSKYEKQGITVNTYAFPVLEIEAPKLNRDSNGNDAPPHASAGRLGGIDDDLP